MEKLLEDSFKKYLEYSLGKISGGLVVEESSQKFWGVTTEKIWEKFLVKSSDKFRKVPPFQRIPVNVSKELLNQKIFENCSAKFMKFNKWIVGKFSQKLEVIIVEIYWDNFRGICRRIVGSPEENLENI